MSDDLLNQTPSSGDTFTDEPKTEQPLEDSLRQPWLEELTADPLPPEQPLPSREDMAPPEPYEPVYQPPAYEATSQSAGSTSDQPAVSGQPPAPEPPVSKAPVGSGQPPVGSGQPPVGSGQPLLPPPGPVVLSPLSPSEERTWAMLAHLSMLVNLFTAFLGPLAALAIYLMYKDRSRYVAYQSLQSFFFQLVAWVGAGIVVAVVWTITGILSAVLVGILCIPLACLISLVPFAAVLYSVWAAIECNQGRDFRYWLIGDMVRDSFSK